MYGATGDFDVQRQPGRQEDFLRMPRGDSAELGQKQRDTVCSCAPICLGICQTPCPLRSCPRPGGVALNSSCCSVYIFNMCVYSSQLLKKSTPKPPELAKRRRKKGR